MERKNSLVLMTLLSSLAFSSLAEEDKKQAYKDDTGFGGPAETGAQLEDDAAEKYPILRFPRIDKSLGSIKDWKQAFYKDTGLQLGLDYTVLYQNLSDTTPGAPNDDAMSGIARLYGKWELVNKGTKNKGSLTFKIDHRHELGDTTPSELGGNAGYLSQTGMLFSDKKGVIVDFNWQQYFNDGNTAIIVGKYDPNDFFNVLGYSIPWTAFSNLDTLLSMSIALPDNSFGVGMGHWFTNQYYVNAAINDANGTVDTDDYFEEGFDELYKTIEFGYTPSREERYFKNVHVTLWQMDEKTAYGEDDTYQDGAEGVVIGANYTWDLEWMLFTKIGFSSVDSAAVPQLYERDIRVGFIKYFAERSDLFGMSLAYGEIPKEFGTPNDSQTTVEAFYRFQLAQNFAITPNVQYLIDPALNTEDDVLVTGLRFRITL